MDLENVLKAIYYDHSNPSSFSTAEKLYRAAKEHLPNLKLKQVKEWLSGELTYTLHKPSRRTFSRNPIVVEVKNQQWEADLVDMQEYKRFNKGYNYILTVIDVMSKFAWAKPLKNKSSKLVIDAFKDILDEGRQPFYLRTDQGKEFLNKDFKRYLKSKDIHHFTSKNQDIKCAIVERFNRTLKGRMFKYFTAKGTRIWYNILSDLLIAYNNTRHKTIKATPVEALNIEDDILFHRIYGAKNWQELYNAKKNKKLFDIDDTVGKQYKKGPFDKSYFPNWTDQIYKISSQSKHPIKTVYKLDDGQNSLGERFYPEQVQKVKENFYRIEKIIKRRTVDGVRQCYIKWLNYPDSFNTWINEEDINKL